MQKTVSTDIKFSFSDKNYQYKNDYLFKSFNEGQFHQFDLTLVITQLISPHMLQPKILFNIHSTRNDKTILSEICCIDGINVDPEGNLHIVAVTNGPIYNISSE